MLFEEPLEISEDLHDFECQKILSISSTGPTITNETHGVVTFETITDDILSLRTLDFLDDNPEFKQKHKELLFSYVTRFFITRDNTYYPLFVITPCKIGNTMYNAIVTSYDKTDTKPFGLATFEGDGDDFQCDPHTASVRSLPQLRGRSIMQIAPNIISEQKHFLASMNPNPQMKRFKLTTSTFEINNFGTNYNKSREAEEISNVFAPSKVNVAPKTPNTLAQSQLLPEAKYWLNAVYQEIYGMFITMQSFKPSLRIGNEPVIGMTWTFRIKYIGEVIARFKARLCVQGFSQIFGLNFTKRITPNTPNG